jgi:hypothetical protein
MNTWTFDSKTPKTRRLCGLFPHNRESAVGFFAVASVAPGGSDVGAYASGNDSAIA